MPAVVHGFGGGGGKVTIHGFGTECNIAYNTTVNLLIELFNSVLKSLI